MLCTDNLTQTKRCDDHGAISEGSLTEFRPELLVARLTSMITVIYMVSKSKSEKTLLVVLVRSHIDLIIMFTL